MVNIVTFVGFRGGDRPPLDPLLHWLLITERHIVCTVWKKAWVNL